MISPTRSLAREQALAVAVFLAACRPTPTVSAPVETDASDASDASSGGATSGTPADDEGEDATPKSERPRIALAMVDAKDDAGREIFASPADWGTRPAVSKDGLVPALAAGGAAASAGPVQNGAVYELGSIPIGTHTRKVAVPADAIVVKGSPSRHVYVATKKTLAFMGHPPERMPLVGLRTNMGCATTREGSRVVLGTFGEWDSRIAGTATMKLLVRVPDDVIVERARNLSGPESLANHATRAAARGAMRVGYWYAPTVPTEGWEKVSSAPDPRHLHDTGRGP